MDFKMDKVGVIVPVYKVEKYIRKCVDSLLAQTYQNIEIILVDDGSPDRCPEICDEYAEKYSNVVCYHKENGGLSDARNYGVRRTDCKWIAFVDSDDYVEKTYISTLVGLQKKAGADLVITRASRENEDGSGKQKHTPFKSFAANNREALYEVYAGVKVGWSAYGKLYKREVLLEVPFPDGYFEDSACMYKIIERSSRIVIGDYEENYHYIQRDGSILCSPLNEKHMHIFDIAKEFEQFVNEKHPDMDILIPFFYRRAIVQILNLQSMPWKNYKEIFMKHRYYFRKYIFRIITDKKINTKSKVYFFILCTRPELFKLQRKLLEKSRA